MRALLDAQTITQHCKTIIAEHTRQLDRIAQIPKHQAVFRNTFHQLAIADNQAAEASVVCTLPALVSDGQENAPRRENSSQAKKELLKMWGRAYARSDVYSVLRTAMENDPPADPQGLRFARSALKSFERNGVALDQKSLADVVELKAKLSELTTTFEQNINEDSTTVGFTEQQLEGLPESFIKSLERSPSDQNVLLVGCKAPQLVPVMQRAVNPATREAMKRASDRRCMQLNGPLLEQITQLRHQIAQKLGYQNHADFMMEPKMAHTAKTVWEFLEDIAGKLKPMMVEDLKSLRELKQQHLGANGGADVQLHDHDLGFYTQRLKEKLGVDEATLQPYFPMTRVVAQTLGIYQEVLGVTFTRVEAPTEIEDGLVEPWHKDVQLFRVCDSATGSPVGHFYLDIFSRNGKFGHQCVVPLRPSFVQDSGERVLPACLLLGNMTKPSEGKPSLLRFAEVETFFHEFGHVMHAVCANVQYSLFSWAWPMVPFPGGVEQDFLEVPSMMFQEWVYTKEVLDRLSGHVDDENRKLPQDVIDSLVRAKNVMEAYSWSRFIAMAMFDMHMHSGLSPYTFKGTQFNTLQELYAALKSELTTVPLDPETHFAASWYHMVIGYDAGYYGYLWSLVYAHDMFSCFGDRCLDEDVGGRLRRTVLGPCASQDGFAMLEAFLGRKPNDAAFLRGLGITKQ